MIRRFFLLAALFILTLTSGCVPTLIPTLVPDTALPVDADAQPVIIDTDMAADDWLAILYLLGQPDLDILAITVTGAGEAHCDAGTQNALDLALLAGRPDIPVSCGRETPLVGNHVFPEEWRKAVDAMFWLSLPVSDRKVADETAVGMLTRIIRESPQKVHVITLGPLTNLAEALNADPGLVENLEMITIMGGAVDVPGNVGTSSSIQNQTAEWNFYVDPQAALDVLEAGAPITLVHGPDAICAPLCCGPDGNNAHCHQASAQARDAQATRKLAPWIGGLPGTGLTLDAALLARAAGLLSDGLSTAFSVMSFVLKRVARRRPWQGAQRASKQKT